MSDIARMEKEVERWQGQLLASERLRVEDAAALTHLREERDQLRQVCEESNAVCACGCPVEDHESYDEDGESCAKNDDSGPGAHSCYRTSRAAQEELAQLREERDHLERQNVEISARLEGVLLAMRGEASDFLLSWPEVRAVDALREERDHLKAALETAQQERDEARRELQIKRDIIEAGQAANVEQRRHIDAIGRLRLEDAAKTVEAQLALTALRSQVEGIVQQMRKNADMLAEGNKDEHFDPSVGMQHACADALEAALRTVGGQKEAK